MLLITPPFTQLNTPYPATPYLKGFLNTQNIVSYQIDLGIEVILQLFSAEGLQKIKPNKPINECSENAQRIYKLWNVYVETIDEVIAFLQGKNPTLARQICSRNFLPEAARFSDNEAVEDAFGWAAMHDKAKHLATLYLHDLNDFFVECVDENFGFSRYAEQLGRSANTFDNLYQKLSEKPTCIDEITTQILHQKIKEHKPTFVAFSVPFPGNLYSAFRCAAYVKTNFKNIKILMGGGFANTELRELADPRVFEFFDYITLDNGELPILAILKNNPENNYFKRTFLLENQHVKYIDNHPEPDFKPQDCGTPDYTDLPLGKYISVIEIANPMHSLWTDGRWNKLTMANGCYWGKCTFCDTSLAYIKNYEPNSAKNLVDKIEILIQKTGEKGFHFVDEAAPPALMRDFALEIIKRKVNITWWTNIRFEKSFTKDLCLLLKKSGCVAVSGGLEVASDRLLQLIDKGVSVSQVAQVTHHFTQAGIMVHAYLMYGYPTQTVQETVDSLEMVRQLFQEGCLQSGFWHQFALTTHSPIGQEPEKYNIIPQKNTITFAHNDVDFMDKTGIKHEKFSFGLKKSLYNYMHNVGFDSPLNEWFDFKIPKTAIAPNYIKNSLQTSDLLQFKPNLKIIFIGNFFDYQLITKTKKGIHWQQLKFTFHNNYTSTNLHLEEKQGLWLAHWLPKLSIFEPQLYTLKQLKDDFELEFDNFELFWYSKPVQSLKDFGLLTV